MTDFLQKMALASKERAESLPTSYSSELLDGPVFGFFWLMIKAILLIFIMMWFRWTFPRLRVDQLMYLCWKVFVPFALVNLFLVSLWELII